MEGRGLSLPVLLIAACGLGCSAGNVVCVEFEKDPLLEVLEV